MTPVDAGATADDEALGDQIGQSTSILLEVPGICSHESEACTDLLLVDDPSSIEVMTVTFNESPDDIVESWQCQDRPFHPAKSWFVTASQYARSTAAETGSTITTPDNSIRVDTVSTPGKLTRLGVAITDQLREYQQSDSERQLVFCMRSLGTLLQFAETKTVFKFLHALKGQLEKSDAVAHYHIDPAAHDETAINTLRTQFDAIISFDESKTWTVKTRS